MSMRLAKNLVAPFDYYSEDNSDPIVAHVTLDGEGGEVSAEPADPIYVVFENDTGGIATIEGAITHPAGPLVELLNEETGINWELSANGVNGWGNQLTLANQNVGTGTKVVQIFARVRVNNDGSIATNNYVQAKFHTLALQKPAAV